MFVAIFSQDKVFLCSPGWPGTHYVDETCLQLLILLSLTSECRYYKHVPTLRVKNFNKARHKRVFSLDKRSYTIQVHIFNL